MKSLVFCLLLFGAFSPCVLAQDTVFFDDFETGNDYYWEHEDGWTIIRDSSNYVFEGIGHKWATPALYDYSQNTVYQARFKLIEDGFHFNLLFQNSRYYFPLYSDFIEFKTGEHEMIDNSELNLNLNTWHTIRAITDSSNMKLYIDDSLYFDYQDPARSEIAAIIAFECIGRIYIDDVLMVQHSIVKPANQEYSWFRTGGPWGGIGYDVRIDPSNHDRIYVTDQWAGNHKSIDGGQNWYPNNNGIGSVFGSTGQSVPVFCLTIDPTNTNNVWCGTFNKRGVYKSTDYGENWILKINGIPGFNCGITFRGFAVRPDNSDVVFCSVEIPLCADEVPEGKDAASVGKIFKTVDGGDNWVEVLSSDALVRHILINTDHPDTMYASTGIFDRDCVKEEGVWKSTDGGENWFHINNGLSDLTVGGLFMDPNDPETIWATTGRESGFGGDDSGEIFVTRNGGQEWDQVYPTGNDRIWPVNSVATAGNRSDIIYAVSESGYYVSMNSGVTWKSGNYGISGTYTGIPVGIATHPQKENIVLINSYSGGVFISKDYGNSWSPHNKGYTGAEMLNIVIDPETPINVIANGRSGIAKTRNAGNTWTGAGNNIGPHGFSNIPIGEYTGLEMNPQNRNSLLSFAFWGSELLKTTDWMNWQVIFDFRTIGISEGHGIGSVEYSNSDSSIMYLGIRYRTLPLILDRPNHFDPDIISFGMLKSEDSGVNWEKTNNGLDETTKNIQAIEIHPTNDDIVYIGVYGFGIYKSIDGGQSWEQKSSGLTSFLIADIQICKLDPNILFAGAEDGGVFKSTDGGENWQPVMIGMDPEASVRSIAFHPGTLDTLYASDWNTGVYYTDNGGEAWTPLNMGLTQKSIQKLAISKDASILYAATQGSGVFRLPLSQFPPMLESTSYDTSYIVTVRKGDTITLSVDAFDINNDSLSYFWKWDRNILEGNETPFLCLQSDTLEIKDYSAELVVSDSASSIYIRWNLSVVENSSLSVRPEDATIKVYPNPLVGNLLYFDIEDESELEIICIFDISGHKVLELLYTGEQYVDFSNTAPGIYLLRFDYIDRSVIFKVVR